MTAEYIRKLREQPTVSDKLDVIRGALVGSEIGFQDSEIFLSLLRYSYSPYTVAIHRDKLKSASGFSDTTDYSSILDVTQYGQMSNIVGLSRKFSKSDWHECLIPVVECSIDDKLKTSDVMSVLAGSKFEIKFGIKKESETTERCIPYNRVIVEPYIEGKRAIMVNRGHFGKKMVDEYGNTIAGYDNIIQDFPCYIDGDGSLSVTLQRAGITSSVVFDGVIGESGYYIFDIIPLNAFENGIWKFTQNQRTRQFLELLKKDFKKSKYSNIMPNNLIDLESSGGRSVLDRIWGNVNGGKVMIKVPDATYVRDWMDDWNACYVSNILSEF